MCRGLIAVGLAAVVAAGCGGGAPHRWSLLVQTDRDGDWAVYALPLDGGRPARLPGGRTFFDSQPLPSPDGRRLLFAGRGLSVSRLAGSRLRLAGGSIAVAAWSPDGSRIAYADERPGIAVVRADGSQRRRVTRGGFDGFPAWSPDGRRIAYDRGDGGLYVVTADGGEDAPLSNLSTFLPPAWSPDGTRLAFVGGLSDGDVQDLFTVDVASGRLSWLAPSVDAFAWSPDGSELAYTALRNAHPALFVVAANGSSRRRLTTGARGEHIFRPLWSPDGRRLYFNRGGESSEIWSLRRDGADPQRLTRRDLGGNDIPLGWVEGSVPSEAPPRLHAGKRLLRVPFLVGEVSADDGRVAVAPLTVYGDSAALPPTGPVLLWQPGARRVVRFGVASCRAILDLVLAGRRLAFDCDRSAVDLIDQSLRVLELPARRAIEVFHGRNGSHGELNSGRFLGRVAGGGDLIAFTTESSRWNGRTSRLTGRRLWRLDGRRPVPLRAGRSLGHPVAAGSRRVVLQGGAAGVEVVDAAGRSIRLLAIPSLRSRPDAFSFLEPRIALSDDRLAVLEARRLGVYDLASGRRIAAWPLPGGRKWLAGGAGGLVAYVRGREVRVVRLRDGAEARRVARAAWTPAAVAGPQAQVVRAALSQAGLFYSYNVEGAGNPGRVVFTPASELFP